jgi:hypothetical protein
MGAERMIRVVLNIVFATVALMVGSSLAFASSKARPPVCSHTKCNKEGVWSSGCNVSLNTRCVQYTGNDCQTQGCPL